jgi:hypothetical protein
MRLAAAALLLMGMTANAQYRRDYDDDHRRQREPLDHVRADLERAAHDMYYLSEGELRRFNRVRQEIGEFQQKWERGRYDKHELGEVIGRLQSVVDKNRLQPRDRDRLFDDLMRLREFRAHLR